METFIPADTVDNNCIEKVMCNRKASNTLILLGRNRPKNFRYLEFSSYKIKLCRRKYVMSVKEEYCSLLVQRLSVFHTHVPESRDTRIGKK